MMNIGKYFDKNLEIATKDKTYHIEKVQLFIHDSSSYCGPANIMVKNNILYVLKEVYSLDKNKRLRYSYDKYYDPKIINGIVRSDDGSNETPIVILETWSKRTNNIGSIGNIKKIHSDRTNNENTVDQPLILKLIRRNRRQNQSAIESLIEAA